MSSLRREKDLFEELHSFLVTTEKLDPTDASIYVLALKKGIIRSSDVSDEFPKIRLNAAIARLKALAERGFLEVAPKETISKRPYAMSFKAIHPRTALKDIVEKAIELPNLLGRYDEHWEFLAENLDQGTGIWLAKSAKVAIALGASMISGAKKEIKIYCHDCSWFEYMDIQSALEDALTNKVSVSVIADGAHVRIAKKLMEMGISLYSCGNFKGPPFCIIDNCWLILPAQTGTLSKKYSSVRTNNKYLVDHFASLFGTAISCSKPWGK